MKFDAGDYYYDTRHDKPLVIISADSDNITYQYVDPKKKQMLPIPNQKQHVLDNESASYFVSKGAWGKWKQKFNYSEQSMKSKIAIIERYVSKIISEEQSTNVINMITCNIGGAKYVIRRDGSFKRLGSEPTSFDRTHKIVGAVTNWGGGNRRITKDVIELSINDIFSDPDSFVGTYPIRKLNGELLMGVGNSDATHKESNDRVLWVKFQGQ